MTKHQYIIHVYIHICIYVYAHVQSWSVTIRAGWCAAFSALSGALYSNTPQSLITTTDSLQWLYSRGGTSPSGLQSSSLKRLSYPPFVSKADWLRKSERGGTSSGFQFTSLARLPSITPLVLDILTLFSLILRNKKESRMF